MAEPPPSTKLRRGTIASSRRILETAEHLGPPEHTHDLEDPRRHGRAGQGNTQRLCQLAEAQAQGLGLGPARGLQPGLVDRLKDLLHEHPGESEVFIAVSPRQTVRLPPDFCVETSNTLLAELRVLLGPDAVLV